jgi:hypothetical protein
MILKFKNVFKLTIALFVKPGYSEYPNSVGDTEADHDFKRI